MAQLQTTGITGSLNVSTTITAVSFTSSRASGVGFLGTASFALTPSGTSGTSGANGSSGTSGANGSSGTSGANGSSGTSGATVAGSSGTSGANGSSGTSGATVAGSSGTSGTSASVTINNNTDNYLVTATGTTNTLNGEANLTFDGTSLTLGTGNVTVASGKGLHYDATNYYIHPYNIAYGGTYIVSAFNSTIVADFDGTGTTEYFQVRAGAGTPNVLKLLSKTSGAGVNNSALTLNDNVILNAANYSSYALPLSGGTMTGVITTPNGTFGIIVGDDSRLADRNIANTLFLEGVQNNDRGYVNFSSTTGNALGAIDGGALTWRGSVVLHAGNYNSYALPLSGGTVTGNVTVQTGYMRVITDSILASNAGTRGLIIDGNYTNGQYRHRIRKYDDGNGIPLYIDYAHSSADSYTAIARFGGGGTYRELEVYGTFSATTVLQGSNQVVHAGNVSSYALPIGGGTVTGLSVFNGKITLGSNSTGTYNGNTGGLTINSTAEVRSTSVQNPPALTWHWEGIATRHLYMTSGGTMIFTSPTDENSGVAVLAVTGNLGINTTSTSAKLHVVQNSTPGGIAAATSGTTVLLDSSATDNYITFRVTADTGKYSGFTFADNNVGGYIVFRTYVGSGANDGSNGDAMYYGTYTDHIFQTGTSGTVNGKTEAFRIKDGGDARLVGSLFVSTGNTTGKGIVLADDGDIVDLNDGYCSMRFSYGVRVFSANGAGSAVIALRETGNIIASADVVAYGSPSDITLKENINTVTNALDTVTKLRGVTFQWKETADAREMTNITDDIGFIAQEVQEVLPTVVRENANGKLSLRDKALIPLLVEAIKEQQQTILSLQNRIETLENQ